MIQRTTSGYSFTKLVIAFCASAVLSFSPSLQAGANEKGASECREALRAKYRRPASSLGSTPDSIPAPADNRWSKEKELVGQKLFFDPRLSGSGLISCATCHNPGLGWGDGLPKAIGEGMHQLGRRTPTILNVAWADQFFWDGRADSLEAQALGPIGSASEMNQDIEKLVEKLRCNRGYAGLFAKAFPGEGINVKTLAKAVAAYERTIVSGKAPFDVWIGGDERAISAEAKTGFDLFNGKAGCARCHNEWNFSDNGFHDIGLKSEDPGRGKFVPVTSQSHAFKTPGLRNIERRAPYMHDGSESTLEDTIEFYDRGGDVKRPSLAPEIKPLRLTAAEKHALVAFLKTLTSEDAPVVYPQLPR